LPLGQTLPQAPQLALSVCRSLHVPPQSARPLGHWQPVAVHTLPPTQLPEPTHAPDWQVSLGVQALPSLHVEPSALLGFEHAPVPGLQVPAS